MRPKPARIVASALALAATGCATAPWLPPFPWQIGNGADSVVWSAANAVHDGGHIPMAPQAQPERATGTERREALSTAPPPQAVPLEPRRGISGDDERLEARIVAAYQAFQLKEVIRLCERQLAREDTGRDEWMRAMIWAAAASYLMGDADQAREYFREALGLNPGLEIDAEVFPTGLIEFFQKVKGEP